MINSIAVLLDAHSARMCTMRLIGQQVSATVTEELCTQHSLSYTL